jgi:hypothetical protein
MKAARPQITDSKATHPRATYLKATARKATSRKATARKATARKATARKATRGDATHQRGIPMTGSTKLTTARLPLALIPLLVLGCQTGEEGPPDESTTEAVAPAHNTLTAEEVAAGWKLLFDGVSTAGWRGYNQGAFPEAGWGVADGNLIVMASDGSEEGMGGDIVTEEEFSNFELIFEFLVTPVGNSGVFYRVVEDPELVLWQVAPEYQVLDDSAYIEMGTMDMHKHLTGDNYDLQASSVRASNPIGEWNQGRILVDGTHVEHWLNGQKTVEYELFSPEWEAQVAGSKFAPHPEYARAMSGRIGIQDHGHELRYRSIKIRPF